MKREMSAAFFLVALICLTVVVHAQDDADVRRELEAQYKKLAEAHDRKDLKAIIALKTSDFHAIFPDGRVGDGQLMEEYSREFLERNKPPFNLRFTIQKLTVSYNKLIAVAEIFQEAARYQDLAGKRRKVETSVIQREIWAKTTEGWKLKSVDNIHDQKNSWTGSVLTQPNRTIRMTRRTILMVPAQRDHKAPIERAMPRTRERGITNRWTRAAGAGFAS